MEYGHRVTISCDEAKALPGFREDMTLIDAELRRRDSLGWIETDEDGCYTLVLRSSSMEVEHKAMKIINAQFAGKIILNPIRILDFPDEELLAGDVPEGMPG